MVVIAQLVQIGGASYLVDCGEGTQERLRSEGINFVGIDRIFIGHLHGDHYLGLMGLISSMHLLGRKKELHVHGPKELKEVLDVQLRASGTYLRFPLHVHTVLHNSGVVLFSDKRVTITSLALKHRIPCTGFLFKEVLGPRRLRPDRVESIPIRERVAVKNGADVTLSDGTKIPNVELTFDPHPVRSYAYCSDTAYEPALIPFLLGVDLLYHEATFTNAMVAKAKETMHRRSSCGDREVGKGFPSLDRTFQFALQEGGRPFGGGQSDLPEHRPELRRGAVPSGRRMTV